MIAPDLDLGALEEDAYTTSFDDGLLDIFIGLSVVGVGALWLTSIAGLAGVFPVLLLPIWGPARKRWVEPRAGYVEFSAARKSKERRGLRSLLLAGVLAFVLGVGVWVVMRGTTDPEAWFVALVPGLPAVLLGVGALIAGLHLGLHRLLVYGLLLGMTGFVGAVVGAHPGWILLVPGLVITGAGSYMLSRFLRLNPRTA